MNDDDSRLLNRHLDLSTQTAFRVGEHAATICCMTSQRGRACRQREARHLNFGARLAQHAGAFPAPFCDSVVRVTMLMRIPSVQH